MKYQIITLNFTAAGQTKSDSFKADDKYTTIEELQVESNFYNAPAKVDKISFDGDSSMFQSGIKIGFFQSVEKKAFKIDKKIEGTRQIEVSCTDETTGTFVPYYVQFIFLVK